jgi:hypothetical protein
MAKLTAQRSVVLVSALPADVVRALGFHPAGTPEEAMRLAEGLLPAGGPTRTVVMPCASLTLPMA